MEVTGLDDKLLTDLIKVFVQQRFTRCSQERFSISLDEGDNICLRGVELYKHALFMAVINEITLEACTEAIERESGLHNDTQTPIVLNEGDGQVEIPSKITP
jgi:hypothetical protein